MGQPMTARSSLPESAASGATVLEIDRFEWTAPDRIELVGLRGERDAFRRERDAALEQLRKVRAEFERERQTHERALADARAHERGATTKMLAEGAEMRAALERQREIAYQQRDRAKEA